MGYRIERLPLTTVRGNARSHTLARLTRRRTQLPARIFAAFSKLARKLERLKPAHTASEERLLNWLSEAGGTRRHAEILRGAIKRKSHVLLVPLLKNSALPRMDEVLRLITGLELAENLRERKLENVVTLAWPVLSAADEAEAGGSAIIQRTGELEDLASSSDAQALIERLQATLPGTGFTSWVMDQLSRSATDNADLFKARLLLRLFGEERIAILPPDFAGDGNLEFEPLEKRIARGAALLHVPGVILDGVANQTQANGLTPLAYPSISATMIEGKVEQWLQKFGIKPEEVLAREARAETLAKRNSPRDLVGAFSKFKETVLSGMLRAELSLNELDFTPSAEIKKALDSFDIGCDRLRQRAQSEMQREEEINQRQLAKLFHYMLPMGQPQQHVISLIHYLDFYGPEFLQNLRAVLDATDLRHQVVYLAPSKGASEE